VSLAFETAATADDITFQDLAPDALPGTVETVTDSKDPLRRVTMAEFEMVGIVVGKAVRA
jgi:hypothetical protein